MEADAASLRSAAPRWSLAGDRQLLDVLQNLHQKIVNRCQESNTRLEAMVAALDDASVRLRNVNNKFMALSNSQFIESRVYDDDGDVTADAAQPKDPPVPLDPPSELDRLRHSLLTLESVHDAVTILPDSDSESDSESGDVPRVVLRPRDMYSHRPLPHVIGSLAWKTKWHGGVLPDSSSGASSPRSPEPDPDQYSEPELDERRDERRDLTQHDDTTISSSSSEAPSKQAAPPGGPGVPPGASPAAVAAELARRLGGHLHKVPEPKEESPPVEPVRKLYRPEKPASSTIFSDEPPPLDSDSDHQDDIFAELHRNQPYTNSNRDESVVNDLFDNLGGSDYGREVGQASQVGRQQSLFEDESESELFPAKPAAANANNRADASTKKPVGGISLFGNNMNNDTIGAAILKRNRRKSSTSGDESGCDAPQTLKHAAKTNKQPDRPENKETVKKDVKTKQKDIFEDLFAKSEKIQKKSVEKEIVKPKEDKKVDLFNDNIFDDIDDIFTSNIVAKVPIKEPSRNEKSLFDDEDDLFADIATKKDNVVTKVTKENTKSIFDSDDDLFSEKTEAESDKRHAKISEVSKTTDTKIAKQSRTIFEDSDDDIFSSNKDTRNVNVKSTGISQNVESKSSVQGVEISGKLQENKNTGISEHDVDDLFMNKNNISQTLDVNYEETTKTIINRTNNLINPSKDISKIINSPNLFDDDDEIDELFSNKPEVIDKHDKVIDKEDMSTNQNINTKDQVTISKSEIFKGIDDTNQVSDRIDSNDNKDYDNKNELFTSEVQEKQQKNDILSDIEDVFSTHKTQEPRPEIEVKAVVSEPTVLESSKYDSFENDDFDDLFTKPIQTAVNKVEHATVPEKPRVAQKPVFEEAQTDNNQITTDVFKTEVNSKIEASPKIYKSDNSKSSLDNRKEVDNNKNVTENSLQTPETDTVGKPNIFSDIFDDQPPVFEKPTEPKKSKNINALFDDDSDDEALFFKKNDVITDEKPAEFSPSVQDDRLFGLFHDEPPAIDIDFGQKPVVFEKPKDCDQESSKDQNKPAIIIKDPTSNVKVTDTSKPSNSNDDIFTQSKQDIETIAKENLKPDESDNIDGASNAEVKKIGKLKPMNFNINVNLLLPGASPKKQKPHEQTDGQAPSNTSKSNEELHTVESDKDYDSKLVKSVSFEGDRDSGILDNKLSKERAKIQVKRRPSTRRARREAVKKSGIDFGEDSTDNSSSIDDAPKSRTVDAKTVQNVERTITPELKTGADITNVDGSPTPELKKNVDTQSNAENNDTASPSKDFTSKIVYILNDEDIFADSKPMYDTKVVHTEKVTAAKLPQPKVLNIVDDDDDIFKTMTVASKIDDPKPDVGSINTLGKAYMEIETEKASTQDSDSDDIFKAPKPSKSKTENVKPQTNASIAKVVQPKKSLFDDLSDDDDELFNPKKNTVTKKSVFNSDSDEELFGTSRKERNKDMKVDVEREKEMAPKTKTKKAETSLFSDDDDDLFTVKNKKVLETKSQPTSEREPTSATQPVFDDPLSLFGDNED